MTRYDLIKLYQANRWSTVTIHAETLGEFLGDLALALHEKNEAVRRAEKAEARVAELEDELPGGDHE